MADHDRTASLMTPSKLAQVRPRAPSSPAAWLDQMAADAGHAHVRRLVELLEQLQAQGMRRDLAPLAADLTQAGEALPLLDFGLLQRRSWWQRAVGKGRSSETEFVAQFEQLDEAARLLAQKSQALQKKHQEQAGPSDLALLEVEVEYRAIDKIIDQGARWLQDMRNQLKTRQAAVAGDEAGRQQIRDDAARCEILVARLKALRAVSSAAAQSHQLAQSAGARRAALVHMLQQMVATNVKDWRTRLSAVAAAADKPDFSVLSLEAPRQAHREFQLALQQAAADCHHVRTQESALAESLGLLGTQLQAVASN
jgi:hypothetical protein